MRKFYIYILTISALSAQTTYTGSSFTIAPETVTTGELVISDNGTITDLNVTINASHEDYIGIVDFKLISPYGTIVDLVTSGCSGPIFSETTFNDEASIPIASGTPPYYGSFQPEGSLSNFDAEEMNGTWTLWTYSSDFRTGSVTDWSIIAEYDDSTPTTPPVVSGTTYTGSSFTIAPETVTTGELVISDNGTITDLNVTINASHEDYIGIVDFKLISPYGTIVDLVTSGCSGPIFSETTFNDEASIPIASGTPPYYGSFGKESGCRVTDFELSKC